MRGIIIRCGVKDYLRVIYRLYKIYTYLNKNALQYYNLKTSASYNKFLTGNINQAFGALSAHPAGIRRLTAASRLSPERSIWAALWLRYPWQSPYWWTKWTGFSGRWLEGRFPPLVRRVNSNHVGQLISHYVQWKSIYSFIEAAKRIWYFLIREWHDFNTS